MLTSAILRQAVIAPSSPAIDDSSRPPVTYGELAETAGRYATAVRGLASTAVPRVGVLTGRSQAAFLGIAACLFAGVTFVPLNPKHPVMLLRAMITRSQVEVLLCDDAHRRQAEELASGARIKVLPLETGSSSPSRILQMRGLSPHIGPTHSEPDSHHVAYILFTSGSTGQPKAVPITYGNLSAFLVSNLQRLNLPQGLRFSQVHELTFDASMWDITMAWASGGCICPIPELELLRNPARAISRRGISAWFSVPSLIQALQTRKLLPERSLQSIQWSFFGGEILLRSVVEQWLTAAPSTVVENLYGPTELTMACLSYRWQSDSALSHCFNNRVPIGRPFPSLISRLIDEQGRESSSIGELCISGPQMFSGYLNDEDRTSKSFVKLPVNGENRTFYKTGDIVQDLGSEIGFTYIGRVDGDGQVKLQGVRIDVPEIEGWLQDYPGVVAAKVLAWPTKEGRPEGLAAFIVGEVNVQELRHELQAHFLPIAVPRHIVTIPAMPLTSNGKVDRAALMNCISSSNQ